MSILHSSGARRGPVVHLTDLAKKHYWRGKRDREALLAAQRGPVVHRATSMETVQKL